MEVQFTAELKENLVNAIKRHLEEGLLDIRQAIADVQEAANGEEKSSAGDKFETGREMMQLELDKLTGQEIAQTKMIDMANSFKTDKNFTEVQAGAMVKTEQGLFLIAAPVGKLKAGETEFYAISMGSPLGQKLQGLRKGDTTELNGRKITVLEVR
jgi:transcription elongation GreA/GreB family factor